MNLNDYEKKTFIGSKGLYRHGGEDNCPLDHLIDCLNVRFKKDEIYTRSGLSKGLTGGRNAGILRWHYVPGVGTFILYVGGYLHLGTAGSEIIQVAAATDFSILQFYTDRIFIAFHDGVKGLSGTNLKIYQPSTGEIRDAGGSAISTGGPMTASDGAASTLMNAGDYLIRVVGETDTGHYLPPSAVTTYTSPGLVKISLADVLTGTTGVVVKRHIIITKANEEEYFFLPDALGGLINDNTTTTATLDFDDTLDLVESADYLFDLRTSIEAPLKMISYKSRLALIGMFSDRSRVYFSREGEPESFSSVDGFTDVTRDDEFTLQNAFVDSRGLLILCKSLGTHYLSDIGGNVPSDWGTNPIDESINIGIWGITQHIATGKSHNTLGYTLVADRSGILLYDGVFRRPVITDKIDDIWQTINYTYYHKIVLVDDVRNKVIYCAIPTAASTVANTLLVGDYQDCRGGIPNASEIKWSIDDYHINPESIGISITGSEVLLGIFKIADSTQRYIYTTDDTSSTDDGTAIESYIELPLVFWISGYGHVFTACRLRVSGSGSLLLTVKGEDGVRTKNLKAIAVTNSLEFVGTGLNDLTQGGTYSGGANKDFVIRISSVGGTDQFQYSSDAGATFSVAANITGAAQSIGDGLTVTFAATTGHTLNDQWIFEALNNPITLSSSPGKEILERFDFTNEKAKFKLRLTSGEFLIQKVEIFGKPLWSMRPA